jgi:hypothetical protein
LRVVVPRSKGRHVSAAYRSTWIQLPSGAFFTRMWAGIRSAS